MPVSMLLRLMALATLTVSVGASPVVVPLRRQEVPVRKNGKVVAHKAAYSGQIRLGWPNTQEFSVVFDTGSGHVAVPSVSCKGPACLPRRRYSLEDSNSAALVNANGRPVDGKTRDVIDITFGTGSITGDLVREVLCLDAMDAAFNGACVEVSIVVATDMSPEPFTSFEFDGIFGLGLQSLSVTPSFNFLGSLEDQGHAEEPEFGIFLRRTAGDNAFGGELAFGGRNPNRIAGPLSWAPVAAPEMGHWQVEVKGVWIGDERLDICSEGCRAIVDTGTSHLGIPKANARGVYDALTVTPGDSQDCLTTSAPDVHFEMPGFTLTLRGQDYMHAKPSPGKAGVLSQQPSICRPRIMPVSMPPEYGSLFIFGEPLLLRYYTVFEWREQKVGFALSSPEEPSEPEFPEEQENLIVMVQVRAIISVRPDACV